MDQLDRYNSWQTPCTAKKLLVLRSNLKTHFLRRKSSHKGRALFFFFKKKSVCSLQLQATIILRSVMKHDAIHNRFSWKNLGPISRKKKFRANYATWSFVLQKKSQNEKKGSQESKLEVKNNIFLVFSVHLFDAHSVNIFLWMLSGEKLNS